MRMGDERFIPIVAVVIALAFGSVGCEGDDHGPTGGGGNGEIGFKPSDFEKAESCAVCHPNHFEEWSGSMHAYAMKDPVWAAVRDLGQSAYTNSLAQACVPCHSIVATLTGEAPWGPLDFDAMSSQSLEGVGCDMCHVVTSISRLNNGGMVLTPGRTKFGTIADPVANPAHESEYHPLYAESEYCGACHDFVTAGGFPLETTYREWKGGFREEWPTGGFATTGKTCNDCHMPTYIGRATPESPERVLHRHTFPGVDLALIDFPQKEEQLALTTALLRAALTMTVTAPDPAVGESRFEFEVHLTNDKTGHDVPSGVPFNREMWLSVVVRDATGSVLFSSGQLNEELDIIADPYLFNAQATMLRADGTPTGAVWEAEGLINPSIKPGETRDLTYGFTVPEVTSGPLTLEVVLRFRSFSPVLFRNLNLEQFLPIPIIDMAEETVTVAVAAGT